MSSINLPRKQHGDEYQKFVTFDTCPCGGSEPFQILENKVALKPLEHVSFNFAKIIIIISNKTAQKARVTVNSFNKDKHTKLKLSVFQALVTCYFTKVVGPCS